MFDSPAHSVKFSHNWNGKLGNRVFATIRKHEDKKADYYKGLIGKKMGVELSGFPYCMASPLSLEERIFKDLPKAFVQVDTGLEYSEACKVFSEFGIEQDTKVLIPTFRRMFP